MFHFLYLDESGSPSMTTRGLKNQRWLTLGGFYVAAEKWNEVNQALIDLKRTWLSGYAADPGSVELHSRDFGSTSPWREMYADGVWDDFLTAVGSMVEALPIVTLSATIDKEAHADRYVAPSDPNELAYEFVIERFDSALKPEGGCGAVVIDPRNEGKGALDDRMRAVHRELQRAKATIVEDPFFPASNLSAGLQVADVCAWAVRKHHSANEGRGQETPIYPAVRARYRRSASGTIKGYGEKLFREPRIVASSGRRAATAARSSASSTGLLSRSQAPFAST